MADSARLVETVLRCYPASWRQRHGDEAAELAALLIRDGTAASSIAWSYLAGAAREWIVPRPWRDLCAMACALLVAACCVSAALLAPAVPARAASTTRAPRPAHCAAPVVIRAMSRPQVIIGETGHGRSC